MTFTLIRGAAGVELADMAAEELKEVELKYKEIEEELMNILIPRLYMSANFDALLD